MDLDGWLHSFHLENHFNCTWFRLHLELKIKENASIDSKCVALF